jgi:hypothetical protein
MENPLEGCKLIKNVVDQVEEIVAENPHSSTRMSDQTNVSHTNVRRILSRRLHMHPHKMFVVQEILPRDHNSRMQYCNFFSTKNKQRGRSRSKFLYGQILVPFKWLCQQTKLPNMVCCQPSQFA